MPRHLALLLRPLCCLLSSCFAQVQEFLEQQGQAPPEALAQLASSGAATEASDAPTKGAEAGAAQGGEGEEDEFVYDVYLPVQPGAAGDDMDQDEAPGVPVVEVRRRWGGQRVGQCLDFSLLDCLDSGLARHEGCLCY